MKEKLKEVGTFVLRDIMAFTVKFSLGVLIFLGAASWLIDYFKIEIVSLLRLPNIEQGEKAVMDKIIEEANLISDEYGNYGSGCQPVKGFAFTARHVVANKIMDNAAGIPSAIYIGDKEARIYSHSSTQGDYAVLTTEPEGTKFPHDSFKFSTIEPYVGQKLYTFSSPGDLPQTFQNVDVLKITKNGKSGETELAIRGTYIESGISGGCINDEHGNFVGIIKTKKKIKDASYIGYATVIKKVR